MPPGTFDCSRMLSGDAVTHLSHFFCLFVSFLIKSRLPICVFSGPFILGLSYSSSVIGKVTSLLIFSSLNTKESSACFFFLFLALNPRVAYLQRLIVSFEVRSR